ncbi:protein transport protein sec31-like [Vigna umbellata]|uniref:protein transport protein sec31-like n=1 Tax=Vigna umbellata TaxID=87088 RepID=UPI001F5EB7A2|nr:protein transport protein sec31-like [Vigna umbellata]
MVKNNSDDEGVDVGTVMEVGVGEDGKVEDEGGGEEFLYGEQCIGENGISLWRSDSEVGNATAAGPRLRHHLAATSSCLANATAATAVGRPCRYSPPPHRDLAAASLRSRCGLVAFSLPPPALNDDASAVSPPPLSRRSSPSSASSPATSIDASSVVCPPPLSRRSSPRRSLPPPPPQSTLPPPFLLLLCRVVRPPLFVTRRSSSATADCRVCLSKFRHQIWGWQW